MTAFLAILLVLGMFGFFILVFALGAFIHELCCKECNSYK